MPRFLTALLCLLALSGIHSHANTGSSYPTWWEIPTATSLESEYAVGIPETDFSPATIGQLKYMANQARDYLDVQLAPIGGAGPQIEALVNAWTPGPNPDDYRAVNLGQLKYTAALFYDRLIAIGHSSQYPWQGGTPDDHALANIGQLKQLFAFDLSQFDTSGVNIMGDGLLDEWKVANGLNPFTTDTMGDGIDDWWAVANGHDPLDPDLANQTSGLYDLSYLALYRLKKDLIGHWPLSGTSATHTTDLSDAAKHAIFMNGAGFTPSGEGVALTAGDAQYLELDDPDPAYLALGKDSFSTSIWFNSTMTGWRSFFAKGAHQWRPGWGMGFSGGSGRVFFTLGSWENNRRIGLETVAAFNDGDWHHVLAVVDADSMTIRIYVDGVSQQLVKYNITSPMGDLIDGDTALQFTAATYGTATTDKSLYIGAMAHSSTDAPVFRPTATLRDARIYHRALTPADVAAVYTVGSGSTDGFDLDLNGLSDVWELEHFGSIGIDPTGYISPPNNVPIPNYALIDLGSDKSPIDVGNQGHVLCLDDGDSETAQYTRYLWGHVDSYPANEYHFSDMNNNGTIGGHYDPDPDSLGGFVIPYEGCGGETLLYDNGYTRAVLIHADQNDTVEYVDPEFPEFPSLVELEQNPHSVISISDNGDCIVSSSLFFDYNDAKLFLSNQLYQKQGGTFNLLTPHTYESVPQQPPSDCDTLISNSYSHVFFPDSNNQGTMIGKVSHYNTALSPSLVQTNYFIGDFENVISSKPIAINHNDLVLCKADGTNVYGLMDSGDSEFALPDGYDFKGLTSPDPDPASTTPLIVYSPTELAIQKTLYDEITGVGVLVPIALGKNAYFIQDFEELFYRPDADGLPTTNIAYTTPRLSKISDNGSFLVGTAYKNGVKHAFMLLKVDVVPDYNRDGIIDNLDRGKVTEDNPYRFWVNDDDDRTGGKNTDGDDTPYGNNTMLDGDAENAIIDGIRDLVDFFPLHIDLKTFLESVDPADFELKIKQEDSAVRFYEILDTELDKLPSEKGPAAYLKDLNTADSLKSVQLKTVTTEGTALTPVFVNALAEGEGILLCEASKITTKPLILEVKRSSDGSTLFEYEFPLSTSPVEQMYRHLNVRSAANGTGGRATEMTEPTNNPDDQIGLTSNKYFVLAHGYNVNGEEGRAWHAEFFKRLWWSGSKAKFVGVSWRGEETQDWLVPGLTENYHVNVRHAINSSNALAQGLSDLQGEITIAAHSLGNMLVSGAIQDHGLSVANYFPFNAAVAIEAYHSEVPFEDNMTNRNWEEYPERLWASEWHALPWEEDAWEKGLTWRGRFSNVSSLTNIVNFYSGGEEVLQNAGSGLNHGSVLGALSNDVILDYLNGPNIKGEFTWALQELLKGRGATGQVIGSNYAGWKFNFNPPSLSGGSASGYFKSNFPNVIDPWRLYTPEETSSISDTDLMEIPFFDLAPDHFDADDVTQLLAQAIPSRSFAMGRNAVTAAGFNNQNMMNLKNGWWSSTETRWQHGDLKDVAYIYTFRVYSEFVQIGALDE